MARRKRSRVGAIGKGDIMTTITQGAIVLGGVAAANLLNKNVSFFNTNPMISAGVQVGLGILTPVLLKSSLGVGLGLGMAASGIRTFIAGGAPSFAESLGLAGLDYSMPPNPLPMVTGLPANVVVN